MLFNNNFELPNLSHFKVTLSTNYLRAISFVDEKNLLQNLRTFKCSY